MFLDGGMWFMYTFDVREREREKERKYYTYFYYILFKYSKYILFV